MSHSPSNASQMTIETIFESPQHKKEILRNVVRNAQALEDNVNCNTLEHVDKILQQADQIHQDSSLQQKIEDQSEVFLDSQVMTISSRVMKKCSYALSKNFNVFDPIELAGKIKSYLNRIPYEVNAQEEDYRLMGPELIRLFKLTPNFGMQIGTLKTIPKKEIVRKPRAPREAQAALRRPESIQASEKTEETVEATVSKIQTLIRDYGEKNNNRPMDFFSLVLHPTDFGRTVENMLHVSFLVRDGVARITLSSQGTLQIGFVSKEENKQKENRRKQNIQNVLALTMKQWKELVKTYNLKDPMIDFYVGTVNRKRRHDNSKHQ